MKSYLAFLVAVLVAAAPTLRAQDDVFRYLPLTIKQVGDMPVACLPQDANPIRLYGVSVAAMDSEWPPDEWAVVHASGKKSRMLKPGECITYNEPLPGYQQAGGGKPLAVGKIYGFAFRSENNIPHSASGIYMGEFCIELRPDGHRNVHVLLNIDDDDGNAIFCSKYADRPSNVNGIDSSDARAPPRG